MQQKRNEMKKSKIKNHLIQFQTPFSHSIKQQQQQHQHQLAYSFF